MDLIRKRILTEHAEDALARFRAAGFEPDQIDKGDNEVAFEFLNVDDGDVYRLLTSVPSHYSAIQGFVGGPPLEAPNA
jgi:hypothetical protein